MKILLAIDGSSYTKQMLAYLVENKELFANAAQDYTVMTVIAPLPTRVNTALSKEVILKYYADESDKITEP
ncbi:MAG: universal stress protein, partial [Brachymonas denitrificans]